MASEKTGLEIAQRRATIKMIKHEINNNIKPQLAILKQLYFSMQHSSQFNPKSYENKMLQRKIKEKEIDLETFKELLNMEKKELKSFLDYKEKFYQKIRNKRIGNENNLKNLETGMNALGISIRNASGSFLDLSTIINELSEKWDNLTDIQKASLYNQGFNHTQFLSLNGQN